MKYYCPYCGIRVEKTQKSCKYCKYQFRTKKQEYKIKSEIEANDRKVQYEDLKKENKKQHSFMNVILWVLLIIVFIVSLAMMAFILFDILMTMRHHI